MLCDVVRNVWRWLRTERKELGQLDEPVNPEWIALAAVPCPSRVSCPLVDADIDDAQARSRPTPFWTQSGVSGILKARRPCGLVDCAEGDVVAGLAPPESAVTLQSLSQAQSVAQLQPPTAAVLIAANARQVCANDLTLARRLHQVRAANRPVRVVSALKRQAQGLPARSAAAAPTLQGKPAASETGAAHDQLESLIRTRPVLLYAA